MWSVVFFVALGGGGPAGIQVIETALRHILVGQSAEDIESLWDEMYWRTLPYGQKGLAIMAISGVDLALWDLRAKRAEKPLANILSDKVQATVPAYCTGRPIEEWLNNGSKNVSEEAVKPYEIKKIVDQYEKLFTI